MIRLGAVTYLNARPLVYGLEAHPVFQLRYDIPSECARLLHAHETDLGLIPSIESLRGPSEYLIVPGPAVTSRGPVASVAIYTQLVPGFQQLLADSGGDLPRFYAAVESLAKQPEKERLAALDTGER